MTEGESDPQAVQRLVQNRQRYLKHPVFCLFCDATKYLSAEHPEHAGEGVITQAVTCTKCGAGWHDVFEIVGIE